MFKIKNYVLLVALFTASISLFSIFSLDSKNSSVKFTPEFTQPLQQTKLVPITEVQVVPAFAAQDPFEKFMDEKAGNAKLVAKSDNSQTLQIQPGKDPFKEFLDKRHQNSKDQVVSPFGKN